jgi:hypothetical protein
MNPLKAIETVGVDIAKGATWLGKEIGKPFGELPKLITLTKDAEKLGSDALPETITVLEDAGALATAVAKDSGTLIADLVALGMAIAKAAADKALNIVEDEAVAAAFTKFCHDFNPANFSDVITAWDKLCNDAHALDATVLADLRKLEADAKVTA